MSLHTKLPSRHPFGRHGAARTALAIGLAVGGIAAQPVFAQAAAAPSAAPSQPKDQDIIVTGSRIPRINEKSASPVAVVSAKEAKLQGTTHAEDLLNSLPQVNAGLNGGATTQSGTATVDLRGIGAFRTLVLMDGRRVNPGDPVNPSADINSIPASLIKRVEVLTGGAASVYGSDAIAGVVNFIMDDKFTGFKVDAQYSANQYNNNNRAIQAVNTASGVPSNTGSGFDGGVVDLNAAYGTGFADGKGHVEVYAGYRHTNEILSNKRDFSACPLVENGSNFSCQLDAANSAAGVFAYNDAAGNPVTPQTLDSTTKNTLRTFDSTIDGYNNSPGFPSLSPFSQLQRPDDRYDAGLFLNYELSTKAKLYIEAQYSHDQTVAQYSPAYTNGATFSVLCNNPLLSADEVANLCTNAGLQPTDTTTFTLGRANVEGKPRLDAFTHDSYRGVLGVKGNLSHIWSYDVYGSYGIAKSQERISNDVSLGRIQNALNVVNVGGKLTCQSVVDGTDPACVPYDIFTLGNVTTAAEKYITAGAFQSGYASRAVLSGVLVGKLGEYGIKSPWADDGVGIVGGTEYRVESIRNTSDAAFQGGDLAVTSPQLNLGGTFRVYEFFTEAHVPIADDKPFLKALSFDFSDRYAHYSLQGTTNSYKFGGEYAPSSDVRLRATYSNTTRAPNGHELFASDTIVQATYADPCQGKNPLANDPIATPANCLNTGLTAAQYGSVPSATSINTITGGNVNLKPETARTFTAGVVFTPSFIPRLSLSVDYWNINVLNFIGPISGASSVSNCLTTGAPIFCSAIHRDASGSLSGGTSLTTGNVFAFNRNTTAFKEKGIDIVGSYTANLAPNLGKVQFNFNGSLALGSTVGVPGQDAFDCIGLYGPNCTGFFSTSPIPKWRHQLRSTWSSPKGFELSLNWRFTGPLTSEFTSASATLSGGGTPSAVDSHIPSFSYFDLAANVDISRRFNLRFGVNNIFGRRAPLTGYNNNDLILPGNQISSSYDTLGRYMFVGLTMKM